MAARQQKCGICMDTFKNPKLISCHHSFCYKCLEDYVQVNLCNGRFDCPVCRTNVELPKDVLGFDANAYIDNDSSEKYICDLCGPKCVACSRCLDCEKNLCQSCCYVHEQSKVDRHHKISDSGSLESEMKGKIQQCMFCDQHPEEEVKLFCTDCKVFVCFLCKAVSHESHATKTVADAAAEVKNTLQTKMNSCSDKLRRINASKEEGEEFERSIDDAEREELKTVEDQRSQLNQLLDQEVAKVKDKIKNIYHNLRKKNAVFKRDLQEKFKTCSNANDNAQKLTDQGTDIEIIKKGPDLEQFISKVISKTDQTFKTSLKNKLFSPAKIKQNELISLIGTMQDSTDTPSLRPVNRDFADGSNFVEFTPRYVWSISPNRSDGISHRPSGQRGRGGSRGRENQTKHIRFSIQKDIKLHHAKEAWKPTHRTAKIDQGEVDIKSEELYKKVRAILNKLTPQMFRTLVAKMQALEIDTESRLKNVVDLVFERAIREPRFRVAYANMCRCLSMFKVPADSKQGNVNFRALLLTRCQREFEKDNSSEKEFDCKRKEIEKASTEEEKRQVTEELEYEEMKAKMRSVGTIRLIGELFKLKMLTENIMHDCVFKLLRTKDEENLECLCRLLKTIGKELETDKAKPRMNQYFTQMQKIINEKKLSLRIRFMLQDVIELRQSKWVPIRNDQSDREVAKEEQDWAFFVQNVPQAKLQNGSRGKHLGQLIGPMGGEADGWNTLSRASLTTDRSIDSNKLKLIKLGDGENIQFCPGDEAARFGRFKGSTWSGARSLEGERSNRPGNRFSALSKANKSEDDGSRRAGGRGGFGQPGNPVNCPSQDLEREKAIAAAKIIVAQRPFEERSGELEPECAKTVEKPSSPVREFIDDQMESKTRTIMDEYMHVGKLEFTKVETSAPTNSTISMAIPRFEESLNDLITNKGYSNEEVFDWIEGQVDEPTTKQVYFIRALMTAVCRSAVKTGSTNFMKVDKSQIQRRNNLLQKYLDHQANFELQALFALQALVHKLEHPPGVLQELFEILYDEDIIAEDAFIQWQKSEDPREQEGKYMAMKQVVQFFTWLIEAEDDAFS